LFLGIDECGREDVEDFIVLAVGPGQVQKLTVYSSDVQVDVDADSTAGKLVDEKIQSVQCLRVDGLSVFCVPQPTWKSGGVHVVTTDGVDAGSGEAGCNVRGIFVFGQVCSKRQVDAPEANAVLAAKEVAGVSNKVV